MATNREYVFVSTLDNGQVLSSFKEIDAAADALAAKMDAAFKKIGVSSGRGAADAAKATAAATRAAATEQKKAAAEALAAQRAQAQADRHAAAEQKKLLAERRQALAERRQAFREQLAQDRARAQAERQAAVAAGQRAAQERAAAREFIRLIRTFPEARQAMAQLAHEQGAFNAVLGQTSTASNTLQSKFNAIIATERQLAAEADKLAQKYGNLNLSFERGSFGRPGGGGGLGGLVGGALSTAGIGLAVAAFEQLRRAISLTIAEASRLFKQLIEDSARTALEFESVEASFTSIFQGNEEVALAVLGRIREESRRLGVDLNLVVRRILPLVGSLEEALKVGELVAGLARLDPERGETGALIAINELLTGDPVSLRKQFELPTDEIVRLQKELGLVEGAIVGLGELLEQRGVDYKAQADTAGTAFARIREYVTDLRNALGQPIIQELAEQFNETLRIIDGGEGKFNEIATAVGRLVAKVAELVGTRFNEFLRGLDPDKVIGLLDKVGAIADLTFENLDDLLDFQIEPETIEGLDELARSLGAIALTIDQLRGIKAIMDEFKSAGNEIGGTILVPGLGIPRLIAELREGEEPLIKFSEGFLALSKIVTLARAGLAGYAAQVGVFVENIDDLIKGEITNVELVQRMSDATTAAMGEVIKEFERGVEAVDTFGSSAEDAGDGAAESTEAAKDAALRYADAIIVLNNNLIRRGELEQKVADAQAEVAEASEELTDDVARRRLEIEREAIDEGLELERDGAARRAKIWRDYADEVADAITKLGYDLQDAGIDQDRKEEDANRKAARDELEIESDLAKQRIRLADKLASELARIQREFDRDAREAIKQNDAIAFIAAKDRAEFESNEARIRNAEDVSDAEDSAEEKRQEIRDRLQEEIDDSQLAQRRKEEDLSLSLGRQLAAEAEARDRSLRELEIGEAAAREKLKESYAEQMSEFAGFVADKLAEYNKETKEERDIIAENLALIVEMEAENYTARLAMMGIFLGDRQALINEANEQVGSQSGSGFLGDKDEDGAGSGSGSGGGGLGGNAADPDQEARIARYNLFGFGNMMALVTATLRSVGLGRQADSVETIRSMGLLIDTTEALYRTYSGFRESMQIQGFEHGGHTMGRQPILVGESRTGRANPEIIVPDGPSSIIPLSRLMYAPPSQSSYANTYNYNRANNIEIAMFHPSYLPPGLVQLHYQLARAAAEQLSGG